MTNKLKNPFIVEFTKNFDVKDVYKEIENLNIDLKKAQDDFSQISQWNLSDHIERLASESTPATFYEMMPLWVGTTALKESSSKRIKEFSDFISQNFNINNFASLVTKIEKDIGAKANEAVLCNLFMMHVVDHSVSLLDHKENIINILEIGGGCGFLAEYLHKYSKNKYSITLTDAIPESLAYVKAYLQNSLADTNIKISSAEFLSNDEHETVKVIPSWKLDKNQSNLFDIVINVSSMQEMPDKTTNAYLNSINNWLREGGIFLFVNSRDYAWEREYIFPSDFDYKFKKHSPRSQTIDHPIDILVKTKEGITKKGLKIERDYLNTLLDRKKNEIHQLQTKLEQNQDTISNLRQNQTIQKQNSVDTISKLKDRIVKDTNTYKSQIKQLNDKLVNQKTKSENIPNTFEKNSAETISKLKDRIAKDADAYKSQIKQLNDELVNQKTKSENNLNTFKKNSTETISKLKDRITKDTDAYKSQIKQLNDKLANQKTKSENIPNTFEKRSADNISKLKNEIIKNTDAHKSQIKQLNDKLANQKTKSENNLNTFKKNSAETIIKLKDRIAKDADAYKSQIKQLNDELVNQKTKSENNINVLKKRIDKDSNTYKLKIEQLSVKLKNLKTK